MYSLSSMALQLLPASPGQAPPAPPFMAATVVLPHAFVLTGLSNHRDFAHAVHSIRETLTFFSSRYPLQFKCPILRRLSGPVGPFVKYVMGSISLLVVTVPLDTS